MWNIRVARREESDDAVGKDADEACNEYQESLAQKCGAKLRKGSKTSSVLMKRDINST